MDTQKLKTKLASTSIQTVETTDTKQQSTQGEALIRRQSHEIEMAMGVAKRFPRDEVESYNRIMQACSRKSLAETAMYEYPRGGQKVTGPSIRLAEVLAQCWGNIDFGIIELQQYFGESDVMAYAWDLETNTRQSKVFKVRHARKAKDELKSLDDPRDIYEMVANQGARRLRSCILGIIPGDITEEAVTACKKTLVDKNTEPLGDRVRKMVAVFDKEYSVKKELLEKYIGCKTEAFTENDIIRLRNVAQSLKDGMSKRQDYFDISLDEPVQEALQTEEKKK